MNRDERVLWLEILGMLVVAAVLAWLIGAPSGWSTADVLRDRALLGVGR